ncbi:MAG: LPS assembly lipoprotein LptE [Flavobacteriaceae bacterium]|nr:LPS assembly lipoprotein LptE [Flavobacteriaceae bacterium]
MKKIFNIILFTAMVGSLSSCGIYSFTGASIPPGTETFQVNYFNNEAGNKPGSTVEPGLDQEFTIALQDLIQNQTNLNLVSTNGDLVYEGEIIEYRISPTTSTANNTAAQNRLTMTVNLRYTNTKKEEDSFETRFTFFYDFDANQQLFDVKDAANRELFERITQDIFNATLAKW